MLTVIFLKPKYHSKVSFPYLYPPPHILPDSGQNSRYAWKACMVNQSVRRARHVYRHDQLVTCTDPTS